MSKTNVDFFEFLARACFLLVLVESAWAAFVTSCHGQQMLKPAVCQQWRVRLWQ
jgi:hypothetical protein